jgi:hypothetical protein
MHEVEGIDEPTDASLNPGARGRASQDLSGNGRSHVLRVKYRDAGVAGEVRNVEREELHEAVQFPASPSGNQRLDATQVDGLGEVMRKASDPSLRAGFFMPVAGEGYKHRLLGLGGPR